MEIKLKFGNKMEILIIKLDNFDIYKIRKFVICNVCLFVFIKLVRNG